MYVRHPKRPYFYHKYFSWGVGGGWWSSWYMTLTTHPQSSAKVEEIVKLYYQLPLWVFMACSRVKSSSKQCCVKLISCAWQFKVHIHLSVIKIST
jgi:hypothetical protein